MAVAAVLTLRKQDARHSDAHSPVTGSCGSLIRAPDHQTVRRCYGVSRISSDSSTLTAVPLLKA